MKMTALALPILEVEWHSSSSQVRYVDGSVALVSDRYYFHLFWVSPEGQLYHTQAADQHSPEWSKVGPVEGFNRIISSNIATFSPRNGSIEVYVANPDLDSIVYGYRSFDKPWIIRKHVNMASYQPMVGTPLCVAPILSGKSRLVCWITQSGGLVYAKGYQGEALNSGCRTLVESVAGQGYEGSSLISPVFNTAPGWGFIVWTNKLGQLTLSYSKPDDKAEKWTTKTQINGSHPVMPGNQVIAAGENTQCIFYLSADGNVHGVFGDRDNWPKGSFAVSSSPMNMSLAIAPLIVLEGTHSATGLTEILWGLKNDTSTMGVATLHELSEAKEKPENPALSTVDISDERGRGIVSAAAGVDKVYLAYPCDQENWPTVVSWKKGALQQK